MLSLKYDVDFQCKKKGFTGEEIKAEGKGGCDALAFVSIIREGEEVFEGSKSFAMFSMDGFTEGEIPDSEWFQIMGMIATKVMDSPDVPAWQNLIAQSFHEAVKDVVTGTRVRKVN